MDILSVFLTWQFILMSLTMAAITYFVRTIVENRLDVISNKVWRDLILPLIPLVAGVLFGLVAAKFPFPEGITSMSGRASFGLVAGLLSANLYSIVKAMLVKKESE